MINTLHKKWGAATLFFTIILLMVSTLIIIFAANYARLQTAAVGNQNKKEEAFSAAEAGIDYAINYLKQNAETVTASPSNGYFTYTNASLTNVALHNQTRFSVVYTNPIANQYDLILIQSTGTASDNATSHLIQQTVKLGSLLINAPTTSLVTKGSAAISGSSEVINTSTNQNIQAGGGVTISGSGHTETSTGTSSSPGTIGSDIQQNSSSLNNISQADFIANYFGTTSTSAIQNRFTTYYNNSASTNYSSALNGVTGSSIWIDQTGGSTASITGNTVIGSATNPVLLVVNGSFSMSGTVTLYGFIFVIGTSGIVTLTGNIGIHGGLATTDNITMSGNSKLMYDATILNNLRNSAASRFYVRVPGSWKDF